MGGVHRESLAIQGQRAAVLAFQSSLESAGKRLADVLPTDVLIPRLVLHGDADVVIPSHNARLLATELGPSCNLQIWSGCGHLLYFQEPHRFVKAVADFLERAEA